VINIEPYFSEIEQSAVELSSKLGEEWVTCLSKKQQSPSLNVDVLTFRHAAPLWNQSASKAMWSKMEAKFLTFWSPVKF